MESLQKENVEVKVTFFKFCSLILWEFNCCFILKMLKIFLNFFSIFYPKLGVRFLYLTVVEK